MARRTVQLSLKSATGANMNVYIIAAVVIIMLSVIGYMMYIRNTSTDTDSDSDDEDNKKNAEKCTSCKVGVDMENFM